MTLAQLQSLLIDDHGPLLALVGRESREGGATVPPATLLRGPIAGAVRDLGYPVADPLSATSAEVEAVPASQANELLARAGLRAMKLIRSRWYLFDESENGTSQDPTELLRQLAASIAAAERSLGTDYGTQRVRVPLVGRIDPLTDRGIR